MEIISVIRKIDIKGYGYLRERLLLVRGIRDRWYGSRGRGKMKIISSSILVIFLVRKKWGN